MPRRRENKFNFIYKTTNLITGKFYIGMHSTNNLEDGYLGSGKILRYSIKKYGVENHKIEKLEFFEDRKKLAENEREIVNETLLKNSMCMNLRLGGEGGGGIFNEQHSKNLKRGASIFLKNQWKENYQKMCKQNSEKVKIAHKNGSLRYDNMLGKHHSEEAKNNIGIANSISQKGVKNSQFGSKWITNGKQNKKIHDKVLPGGWIFGRTKI
jgi:shikimate kinase